MNAMSRPEYRIAVLEQENAELRTKLALMDAAISGKATAERRLTAVCAERDAARAKLAEAERERDRLKGQCESLEESCEILGDSELLAQIARGTEDIKAGRVKSLDCIDGGCKSHELSDAIRAGQARIRDLEAEVARLREALGQVGNEIQKTADSNECIGEIQAIVLRFLAAPAPAEVDIEVAGDVMLDSLEMFEHRCKVHLAEEQRKIAPDNALIAVLCDAVRLCREHGKRGYPVAECEVRE